MTTFQEIATRWLERRAKTHYQPATYKAAESTIRRHLVSFFEAYLVSAITVDHVERYRAHKLEEGLAGRTVDNHIQLLKTIFDYAIDVGAASVNPARKVKAGLKKRSPEQRYLTPDQISQLIEATHPSWRLLIAMAALTGLRKGEQLALTFDDVDFEAMEISVTKTIRTGVVASPKTAASAAKVPLPPSLVPMLQSRRRRVRDEHGLIFCRPDGSPLPDALPNRLLARSIRASGLPEIRWHDLRHSWVVAHLAAGTDIPTLQRLGRWKSAKTLLDTYAHVLPATGGEAQQRVDDLIAGR